MDEVIVTLKDMRKLRYCSSVPRKWFARHGLSWSDFVSNGIPASKLEATGDAMAKKVVEVARGRK